MGARLLRASVLAGIAFLASCANLKEVREYAGQASHLASYKELTVRWVNTHKRELAYVYGQDLRDSASEDKERRNLQKDLLQIHATVADYFAVLAKLAGDDSFTVASNIDELAKSIKTAKFIGLDETHVDAYSKVAKIISGWLLGVYQQREIRKYVEQGNEPIKRVLHGMKNIARAYKGTFTQERGRARYLELALSESGQDRIVRALARAEFARIATETEAAEKRAETLESAAENIADGHQKLYEKRNEMSGEELRVLLEKINKDLKAIKKSLDTLKE